ncbi:hypothetical protein IFR05_003037 [Cadophora sp. M221]|nr:hypothetical protein IFR05_003037 [Cadophora sp. M221]
MADNQRNRNIPDVLVDGKSQKLERNKYPRVLQRLKVKIKQAIAPEKSAYGPLRALQLACKQINAEVKSWSIIYPNIVDTPFGLLDVSLTIFTIVFSNKRAMKPSEILSMPLGDLRNRKMIQVTFKPNCSSRDLLRLAVWKRAMEIAGTIDLNWVEDVIYSTAKDMKRLAGRQVTPELRRNGRKAARRFYFLGILSQDEAYYSVVTRVYNIYIPREDKVLVFQSFSERVKNRFRYLAEWGL